MGKHTEDKQSSQSKSTQTSVCFVTITVFSNFPSRKVRPGRLNTLFWDLFILVLKPLTLPLIALMDAYKETYKVSNLPSNTKMQLHIWNTSINLTKGVNIICCFLCWHKVLHLLSTQTQSFHWTADCIRLSAGNKDILG